MTVTRFFIRTGQVALIAAITIYATILGYLYVNQRHMLFETPSRVVAPQIAEVPGIEVIHLKTPDGETLRAWYLPPKPGQPVMLFLGGQGAEIHTQKGRYIRMNTRGVGFLALSYRGFNGSSGTPTEDGLYTDVLAAYDALIARDHKPSDIVIHGHSLGSGVATYLATQRPARALILEAPFTAAADVAQERYPLIPVSFLMKDKFASKSRMNAIHMPLLIIHGDADTVVPYAHGQRLFALANGPKTFVTMKESDHSTLTRDGAYDYYWRFGG